jgi:hypothetical protein
LKSVKFENGVCSRTALTEKFARSAKNVEKFTKFISVTGNSLVNGLKVMVLMDFTILKIIILRKLFGNFSKINETETFNCGIVSYFFEASPGPWLWLLRLKLLNYIL